MTATPKPKPLTLWQRCQLAWATDTLSHNAKMLHWNLLMRMSAPDYIAYPSVPLLMRDLGLSRATVCRAIEELKASKILTWRKRPSTGGVIEWSLVASVEKIEQVIETYVNEVKASRSGAKISPPKPLPRGVRQAPEDVTTGLNLRPARSQPETQKQEGKLEGKQECMQSATPLGTKVSPSGDAGQGVGAALPDKTCADISGLNGSSGPALEKLRRVAVAANKRTTDKQLARWLGKVAEEHGVAKALKGLDDLLAHAEDTGDVSSIPKALSSYAKGARLNGKRGRGNGKTARAPATDLRDDCQSLDEFIARLVERNPGDTFFTLAQAQLRSGAAGDELCQMQELYETKEG